LEADNKTCASIDDCASSPCEQQCVNTMSGYFCECGAGFALNADGSTCSARTTPVGCGVILDKHSDFSYSDFSYSDYSFLAKQLKLLIHCQN